ncbi:MAG TPA: 4-hydroxy-tetrahydrodipicolinate reductase [Chitinophagales bacterium]|nr:4-hydroxy-tetrahydrodipicolinate reductase [Chitinophagales bacterium]
MKFALLGYGKMGKTIEQVILEQQKSDEIVLKINDQNLGDLNAANLQKADVAIEFSTPHTVIHNIYECFEAGVPVVVGTTAWLNQLEEVKAECARKNGALFYSPNFSIGVNIFWEINRRLALLMDKQPQYRTSMEETHHTEKLDAPSGTAIKTAEVMLKEINRLDKWELSSIGNQAAADKLLIVAKREPQVPGTHIVKYESDVDVLEIKHEAKSRKGFAEGAVLAARWLAGRKGVFEMKDLLAL